MRVPRSRRYLLVAATASLLGGIIASGCSQDEATNSGAEGSPFDPKPVGKAGAKSSLPGGAELPGGAAGGERKSDDLLGGLDLPGKSSLDTRFGANDTEKALREAMRAARNGDLQTASELLDQVLEVQPLNREALLSRGAIAFDQARKEKSPEVRAVAIEKAVTLARACRRAFDSPKAQETTFFSAVLYGYGQHLAQAGQFDDAIKAINEAGEGGFEAYFTVEKDEKMAELRKSPQYRAALKAHDAAILTAARERVKDHLAKPVDLKFQFTHRDLDSKPVSLSDFKGKVVLVDFWGTWCGPCRQAIPFLVDLYRSRKDKGLEIVGLDFEKDVKDEAAAREIVKPFAKQVGMNYPCLIADDATIQQIPGFKGFPTVVILDRAGKVRLVITESDDNTLTIVRNVVEVLLEEPVPPAEPANKPAAEPAKKPAEEPAKKPAEEPKKKGA